MLCFTLLVEGIMVLGILFKVAAELGSKIVVKTIDQPIFIQLHNGREALKVIDNLTELRRVVRWARSVRFFHGVPLSKRGVSFNNFGTVRVIRQFFSFRARKTSFHVPTYLPLNILSLQSRAKHYLLNLEEARNDKVA